jgi:hypothetical protein
LMGPKNVRFARHCPSNRKVAGPNPARSTINFERVPLFERAPPFCRSSPNGPATNFIRVPFPRVMILNDCWVQIPTPAPRDSHRTRVTRKGNSEKKIPPRREGILQWVAWCAHTRILLLQKLSLCALRCIKDAKTSVSTGEFRLAHSSICEEEVCVHLNTRCTKYR